METCVNSLPSIESIENGENIDNAPHHSARAPDVTVLDGPTVIKQETNGNSNHVAGAGSSEMPPEDPGDIEGTDEEDILEIYTDKLPNPLTHSTIMDKSSYYDSAQPSNPGNNASFQASASTKIDRPDFSSTSEDEVEDINFKEHKLLLQSDVSRSSSYQFPPKSRMFENAFDDEDDDPGVRYLDPRAYMRCIPCIQGHKTCNRRLPHCQRCRSPSACLYPRTADFRDNQDALDAFRNSEKETLQSRSPSASTTSAAKRSFDPKPPQVSNLIIWQGGDISHSQKRCPARVINLISERTREFEDTQLAGLWKGDKTVYSERGRDCVFVDEKISKDIPVARYIYKGTKQFFVAWLPAQDTSRPPIPVICKFRVYNNEPDVKRNGRYWMPLRWQIWCPNNEVYHRRDIIRLVATSLSKPSITSRSPEILDLDSNSRNRQNHRLSSRVDDTGLTGHDTDDEERERPAKKLKRGSTEKSWKSHPGLISPQDASGKFLPRSSTLATTHDPAPTAGSMGPRQAVKYLVREPQFKETPLAFIFKDSSGAVQGSYPYRECDTAEKLFDVACVSKIAQIEPPATRLLKVEFEGGGDGCIRPDSASDYDKVIKIELKKLIDMASSNTELRVIIRPYR